MRDFSREAALGILRASVSHSFHSSPPTLASLALLLLGLLWPGSTIAQPPTPWAPTPGWRVAAAAPLAWTEIRSETFLSHPPRLWIVALEETSPGYAESATDDAGPDSARAVVRRPLRQTRLRFTLRDGVERRDLAFLQHIDNRKLEWLAPGDPRLSAAPTVRNDPDDPWPNDCGVDFLETATPLDLDDDDHNEMLIRFMSTIDDPAVRGLLLVEADSLDQPQTVSLAEITADIRMDEATLTEVVVAEGQDPVLIADWRPLDGCRFLLDLEVPGEPNCDECCAFPVVMVRDKDRLLHPTYDRSRQRGYLDRLKRDLALLSIDFGEEGRDSSSVTPLTSLQEAALGRAVAFFYLTGQGARTRENVAGQLGARAELPRTLFLLDRMESYFLRAPREKTQPGAPGLR